MIRRALAAAAAVVVVGLLAAPVAAAPSQSTPSTTAKPASVPVTPDGQAAIDDLVGCVQGSQHLLVLFLIDESASLQGTDPQNRRVDAAKSALDSLAGLASAGAGAPKVDIAFAAFSNKYRLVRNWTAARTSNTRSLEAGLERFRTRNHGIDTDFVNALTSARTALAERAATVTTDGSTAPCRAVLLFTDGGFDIAVRTPDSIARLGKSKPYAPGIPLTSEASVRRAEAAGRTALCRAGGLADGLRGDQVTLLTVALSGTLSAKSQRPLAAATAGKADNYTCGTPTPRPKGAYLPASDVDGLLVRFDDVATRLSGGTPLPDKASCVEPPCTPTNRTFRLDPSLRRAHIFALPTAAKGGVEVTGPKGKATITKAGSSEVGGVRARTADVAGRGFDIDLTRPADDASWTGTWRVRLVDAAGKATGGKLQTYVVSDLGVRIVSPSALERGAGAKLQAEIVVSKGVKVAELVKAASVTMRFDDPVTGKSTTVGLAGPPTGPFVGSYAVPAATTANAVSMTVTLTATSDSGAKLVSQASQRAVIVRRPAGSVQFAPPELQLPSISGTGSTTTDLLLVGGKAQGCVWFGPPAVTGPDAATPVSFEVDGKPLPTKANCIAVAPGQSVTVAVRADPAGRAVGSVRGTLAVYEQVGKASPSLTQIAVRFDLARGVDQTRRLLVAAILLAAGLAGPALLLLIVNTVSARFQQLDAIEGTVVPVVVQDRHMTRRAGDRIESFTLKPGDFGALPDSDSKRSFRFGGIRFHARASRNPFGGTLALAAPEGGAEKLKGGEGSRVELDPSLAGSWVFLLDADRTTAARDRRAVGTLIAFVAKGDQGDQRTRMLRDIEDRLPAVAENLSALLRAAAPKAPRKAKAADPAVTPEVPEVPEVPEATTDAPPEDVPAGFGGRAAAPPAGATPAPAPEAPATSSRDDDASGEGDGPTSPPVGFGGAKPPPSGN